MPIKEIHGVRKRIPKDRQEALEYAELLRVDMLRFAEAHYLTKLSVALDEGDDDRVWEVLGEYYDTHYTPIDVRFEDSRKVTLNPEYAPMAISVMSRTMIALKLNDFVAERELILFMLRHG